MDTQVEKKHWLIRYKKHLFGGIIILVPLAYFLFTSIGPSRIRYDRENMIISEVQNDKFIDYLETEGIAQAKYTIKLSNSESGIVSSIVAEEGSTLKKGDTILILNNVELERLMSDDSDEMEKKQLQHREKILQMERKTSELKRATLKTQHDLNRLSKQYELDKEEYTIGIKSKAQLVVAEDDYNFNKKNSELLLEELKHDSLSNIIQYNLMKDDLAREQQKYGRNSERLGNLIIRAPISGQLSYLGLIPGEKVNAGSSIGEMKVVDELKISTQLDEFYIDRISVGLPAFINYQNEKYELKISKVNPQIKDRTFAVDFVFTDKIPDNVRIGKSYRIQVEMGQPEDAIIVDRGGFYQSTGGKWVFKLNEAGTRATKVDITIGRQNPQQYELIDGLKVGDKVIISSYEYFGNAQEIIINTK